jgi:DNA polymerase
MEADPRAELAAIAASLRAYLEWQRDSGASGIPRGKRAPAVAAQAAAPNVAPEPRSPDPPEPRMPRPLAAPVSSSMPPAQLDPFPEVVASRPAARPLTPPAARRSLDVIAADAASCTRCGLCASRTHPVFSRGDEKARLCFVGDAPGAEEDAAGRPFVGPAGQLLDRMIRAMGLDPERDVYVCNIVKCRPPEGHKTTAVETAACIPFLHEQLEAVAPKVIVALGNTAVGALLGGSAGITKLRGEWKLYKGRTLVMPTYHPAYLQRPGPQQQGAKRDAWEDLRKVMKELNLELPQKDA